MGGIARAPRARKTSEQFKLPFQVARALARSFVYANENNSFVCLPSNAISARKIHAYTYI